MAKNARDRIDRSFHTGTDRLKIVVRRLPSNLPEDIFWQSVVPWVTDETVVWRTYFPGKLRKKLNKENIPSRAYIVFRNDEQLAVFSKEYDGHLFRDKAGNESQAVVEFAPYQKVPSEKRKVDTRMGTIERDDDYVTFLKTLEESKPEPVSMEALIASTQPVPMPKTTPLLEALKADRSALKDKDSIVRNHAHYKDQQPSIMKKEEAKRRSGTLPKPAESPKSKKNKKPLPNTDPSASGKVASKPAPKTPKAMRMQQQTKATVPSDPASTPSPVASISQATPRRPRPVIGLASRQFEAALSSAGVASKPRREKAAALTSNQTSSASTSMGPAPPVSPRRERNRRKEVVITESVPNILPRIDDPPGPGIIPSAPLLDGGIGHGKSGRGRGGRGKGVFPRG